jgi:hypothetical protein
MGNKTKILLLFILLVANIEIVLAAVNMSIGQKNADIGEQFAMNIQIYPNGENIAGIQTDLNFDPIILQAINVTEGNFLNIDGPTIFLPPIIDNINGSIKNIVLAALYSGGEKNPGYLATVNFRALSQESSQLTFVHYLISDPMGNIIPVNIQNGYVNIGHTNKQYNISGYVINAADNNGLSDWSIILSNNTMSIKTNTTTNGGYKFSNINNGEYNIIEESRQGWVNNPSIINVSVNDSDINNQNFTNSIIYTNPPDPISKLKRMDSGTNYIKWSWKDPNNKEFSHVMIFINGIFETNVSKGVQFYSATNLQKKTSYTIGTHTVDYFGNVNNKWVNNTAKTR